MTFMKVFLRNTHTGLYYRGSFEWTSSRAEALDLGHTQEAIRLAAEFHLDAAEVVLGFDDPLEDVALPFQGPWWRN
jgi:hypothetical protein